MEKRQTTTKKIIKNEVEIMMTRIINKVVLKDMYQINVKFKSKRKEM